ncbi:VOC family protein [Nitrosomonas sp. Is37]|uniref:VOC family protein n=1 Tax=Nitrosomonas sp. Is37 TaxID=3080535 RepID=UPI00294B4249|nr:VOC family protein [Nitrosomonas sp. Is37]MDV6344597.1 VOC family protein [Nitrosomonas sp. Is37]
MNNNPVGWFEIYVQDIERAKRFYEAVFQVKLEQLDSPPGMEIELWAFPMVKDARGASGALVKMKDGPSGGNCVLVYFMCTDCAVEATRGGCCRRANSARKNVYWSIRLYLFGC